LIRCRFHDRCFAYYTLRHCRCFHYADSQDRAFRRPLLIHSSLPPLPCHDIIADTPAIYRHYFRFYAIIDADTLIDYVPCRHIITNIAIIVAILILLAAGWDAADYAIAADVYWEGDYAIAAIDDYAATLLKATCFCHKPYYAEAELIKASYITLSLDTDELTIRIYDIGLSHDITIILLALRSFNIEAITPHIYAGMTLKTLLRYITHIIDIIVEYLRHIIAAIIADLRSVDYCHTLPLGFHDYCWHAYDDYTLIQSADKIRWHTPHCRQTLPLATRWRALIWDDTH